MNLATVLANRNSSRYRLQLENADFAAGIPKGARVLDAGAGTLPYRSLFDHSRYESADWQDPDGRHTHVCDLASIPVPDAHYDFILFNQVMEHLPEPAKVLGEFARILRPGGRMIYTGPLFYEEHEQPYDFYRYTQFGLRHLFGRAGLVIERLDWLEGYFGTVAYQCECAARYLPGRPANLGPGFSRFLLAALMLPVKASFLVGAFLFHALERRVKVTARGYPKNYVVIARRP